MAVAEGKQGGLILGIESSCDETAAAVVRGGREVLSNVVASQIALHANYGGVVPELASREHLKNIVPVVRAAMAEAGIGFADLDAVAVTEGPGLAGALLVGITYAKALAAGLEKPLVAVNHLEGHIHAVLMDVNPPCRDEAATRVGHPMEAPLLALVVSGGHTHLYLCESGNRDQGTGIRNLVWQYRNVGRTVDDAAGEAYDKVAKLLGLGYPGGPWMDALAAHGDPRAVEFRFQPIKRRGEKLETASLVHPTHSAKGAEWMGHPDVRGESAAEKQIPSLRYGMTTEENYGMTTEENMEAASFDFSFSGIKTAVLRYVQTHGMAERVEARRARLTAALRERPGLRAAEALKEMPEVFDRETLDLIASFQHAVVGNLLKQTFAAAEVYGVRGVVVSGGVSANSELRRRFTAEADRRRLPVAFPAVAMSTDNAAMIAAAAWGKFCAGKFAGDELVAVPQLRLG